MNPIKILIADNHVIFRQGLELLLRRKSNIVKVKHASDGNEVLEILLKDTIDLIFMDIHMFPLNGIEATQKVKQKYPSIKIVALSMLDDRANIVKMLQAGAEGYLLKNTTASELDEAIKTVMDGSKFYSKEVSEILVEKAIGAKRVQIKRGTYKPELTAREIEITNLICQKFTTKEIASALHITPKTVECHRSNIYSKLNIKNSIDLFHYALNNKIISELSD